MNCNVRLFLLFLVLLAITDSQADQSIRAVRVDTMPLVDGVADDNVWRAAKPIVTSDPIAEMDVSLKAVYNDTYISFLVHFPDATADRQHKKMVWDRQLEIYRTGPKREDVFVLKWSMEAVPVDLTLSADNPYRDEAPRFQRQIPEGSRADVRAKGYWKDGFWTIEFARRLDTGQPDDVLLNPVNRHRFGVSRYEIAGRKPDARLDQPKYGSGEIGEHLSLIFD